MNIRFRVFSPAKINLHLEIGPLDSDGYHPLTSVFQMISFGDTVSVGSLKECDDIRISGDFPCAPEDNIIWKAVELFRRQTGIRQGLDIQVEKRIPSQAGLGGGSSNAAAVLRGLHETANTNFSAKQLASEAMVLGSDVPFFLRYPAALVEGKGGVITELAPRNDYWIALIRPAIGVSTKDAYRWLDESREPEDDVRFPRDTDPSRYYRQESPKNWKCENSFFPVLCLRFQEFGEIISALTALGAQTAGLSGSGSTTYGLFTDELAADTAVEHLGKKGFWTMKAHPLMDMPGVVKE
jgi:4-diphosphocytidyl-2-C-methyl-D-erythritol kinase